MAYDRSALPDKLHAFKVGLPRCPRVSTDRGDIAYGRFASVKFHPLLFLSTRVLESAGSSVLSPRQRQGSRRGRQILMPCLLV